MGRPVSHCHATKKKQSRNAFDKNEQKRGLRNWWRDRTGELRSGIPLRSSYNRNARTTAGDRREMAPRESYLRKKDRREGSGTWGRGGHGFAESGHVLNIPQAVENELQVLCRWALITSLLLRNQSGMPPQRAVAGCAMLSLAMGCGTGRGRGFGRGEGRGDGGGSSLAYSAPTPLVKESNAALHIITLAQEEELMSGSEHIQSLPEHNLGGGK